MKTKLFLLLILLAAITAAFFWRHQTSPGAIASTEKTVSQTPQTAKQAVTKTVQAQLNECRSNTAAKAVIVSLGQQDMWACGGAAEVYQTPVTTGATAYGDGTPTGTWAVYSKQTDTYLKGSDSRGSWNDYVNYWLPFYGAYGFHDASWQTFPFGDLTKYTTQGSHGCVHLPLTAMKWLYNWAPVGATVTIQS